LTHIQFLKFGSEFERCQAILVQSILPDYSLQDLEVSATQPVSAFKDHLFETTTHSNVMYRLLENSLCKVRSHTQTPKQTHTHTNLWPIAYSLLSFLLLLFSFVRKQY